MTEQESKKFHAFGKSFTREEAEWLIFSDKRTDISYGRNDDVLQLILQDGWQGTSSWSDKELQEELDELLEENIVYHGSEYEEMKMPQLRISEGHGPIKFIPCGGCGRLRCHISG